MSLELDPSIHDKIVVLSKEGDDLSNGAHYSEARAKYIEALKLLPDHPSNWEAATWLFVAIGDTHFLSENFEKMMKAFSNAVQCPGGLGNPFIHLRLGQAYWELNELDKSADELTRAYMGGGMDIFMEDDPKYLEFLETRIEM
ncbi:hypothetical protein MJO52_06440 [Microbulbifer variabilis]|uniref:Tetratricopeptide repeat protein n=1 Tax=Microbulbifer variabilis TaxID=266805 RepID=A0ABY4VET8_9GAMM|nr:hypothetical protein [Microbulbifer variabilis]USD22771.1 hypothetical protein MJO52_06440 [Microbulbifer variabilis]